MRESAVEAYLRDKVKQAGGKAYKWVSPGNVGVPDRIVLFPGGRVFFIELKAPGKKPTMLQTRQMEKLRDMGFVAGVIDSKEGVDSFMKEVMPL